MATLKDVFMLAWLPWNAWEACGASCGSPLITQKRGRKCQDDQTLSEIDPKFCSWSFPFDSLSEQTRSCNLTACPSKLSNSICKPSLLIKCSVDGGWSNWGEWSTCSVTCSSWINGTRSRMRACDNPVTSNSGQICNGNDTEIESCYDQVKCTCKLIYLQLMTAHSRFSLPRAYH